MRIIEAIADKLCDQRRPSLGTLKIQLYFVEHYHEKGKRILNLSALFAYVVIIIIIS